MFKHQDLLCLISNQTNISNFTYLKLWVAFFQCRPYTALQGECYQLFGDVSRSGIFINPAALSM